MKKAVLLILAFMAGSCSLIYEDRSGCPCLLTIDYGECNAHPIDTLQSILIGEDGDFDDSTWIPAFGSADTTVEKGTYLLSVWGNGIMDESRRTIIPNARNELYSFIQKLDCYDERRFVRIRPIPEFAETTVRILDKVGQIQEAEFSGCNSGFGFDKSMLSESAVLELELTKEKEYFVSRTNLLRMKDIGTLNIRLTDGNRNFDYPVGHLLKENGYDMTEDFLEPIEIIIDTVLGEITVKTQDWETVESTDIIF